MKPVRYRDHIIEVNALNKRLMRGVIISERSGRIVATIDGDKEMYSMGLADIKEQCKTRVDHELLTEPDDPWFERRLGDI